MYDLTFSIQARDEKCLYEQIYSHIKQEMREGKLIAGERLPSTRYLAEHLQVARSTVEYAYGQLLDEGYIEARPCKGYFVCAVDELELTADNPMVLGKTGEGTEARSDAAGKQTYTYDFSPYGIDLNGFPYSVWKKITKNILVDANSEMFSRGDEQGDYELRLTISRYLHNSRGVNCSPEQIIVGAGNDYLLLLLEKILGRHVPIAMENPTYKRPYEIFRSFAYPIREIPMDEAGLMVSELEKSDAKAVYVMPAHQFPYGVIMPIGRRLELLNWAARENDRYIIEDDYDSEFRYHGRPIPALQASDQYGKVIYMGSFSKSIAPAIRVSFMVLPRELLEKYRRECNFYSCTVSRIDQRILNEFIRDGYFERHLNKMRKRYSDKHSLLLECLKDFRHDFEITGENAGLHLLITSKRKLTEEELIRRAAEVGVRVYGPERDFSLGESNGSTSVLLGFGALQEEDIIEGVARLKKVYLTR